MTTAHRFEWCGSPYAASPRQFYPMSRYDANAHVRAWVAWRKARVVASCQAHGWGLAYTEANHTPQ